MTGPAPEGVLLQLIDDAAVGIAIVGDDLRFRYVNARMAEFDGVPAAAHVGKTISETLPDLGQSIEDVITRVFETGRPVLSASIVGGTAAGPGRHWEASYLLLDTPDGPAVGAVVVDVTDRVSAAGDARRRIRQQTLVADLGRQALRESSIEDLVSLVAQRVRDELDGDFTGIMFLEDEQLVMRAGAGWPPSAMGNVRSPLGTASQAGYSLLADEPVILRDPETEERFDTSAAMRQLGVKSAISTPIPGDPEPVGIFGVLSRQHAKFDEDDAAFMRSVAHVLGSALMNDAQRCRLEELAAQRGRLVAQAHDAAERDQQRIATVLQDELVQQLLSARLELGRSEPSSHARAQATVDEAIAIARSLVASMRPVTLDHAGLTATVSEIAAVHADRSSVEISVDASGEAAGVADHLVISLLRELLDNVERHAEATSARVYVGVDEGQLVLRVSDDGRGLPEDDAPGAADDRLGLAYARERVESLGGSLEAGPGPLGGTTVVVLVPHARVPA